MARLALALAACAAFARMTPSLAAGAVSMQALDDKLPSPPLTASFDKVTDAEGGPYVLKLKNDSNDAVTAVAKIYPSVTIHSDTKERILPEKVVAAGEVWSISGLAAADKVTILAKGFAPLDITVP